jgi:hypothetical protein
VTGIHVWVRSFERVDDGSVNVLVTIAKDGTAVVDPDKRLTREEVLSTLGVEGDL